MGDSRKFERELELIRRFVAILLQNTSNLSEFPNALKLSQRRNIPLSYITHYLSNSCRKAVVPVKRLFYTDVVLIIIILFSPIQQYRLFCPVAHCLCLISSSSSFSPDQLLLHPSWPISLDVFIAIMIFHAIR